MNKSKTGLLIIFIMWFGTSVFAGSHGGDQIREESEQDIFPAVQVRIKITIYNPSEGRKCVVEDVMRVCAALGLKDFDHLSAYSFSGEASAAKIYKITPTIRAIECVKSVVPVKP